VLVAARKEAEAAARAAGVTVRGIDDIEGFEAVRRLFDTVWQPGPGDEPVTRGMLNALVHCGNYCGAAMAGDQMVGASVGFLGQVPEPLLHSHVTATLPCHAGRGIGYALKLHQRYWSLSRGLKVITWTYDPLIRRNAYFNTCKLGALPVEYLIDFYGEMNDAINAGQGSDRLLSRWELVRPHRPGPVPKHTYELLGVAGDEPARALTAGDVLDERALDADVVAVAVPYDLEALRTARPAVAARWRLAVRETLGRLMHDGWQVFDVTRDGRYLLRPAADEASVTRAE
jgi:predicted GNAT superfamily acetyltransferase